MKITDEPPKTLKSNILKLYNDNLSFLNTNINSISNIKKQDYFKKLLFCLTFFHSLLLERRKFGCLGWNIPYLFTQSDFKTSTNILSLYLSSYNNIPWDAIKYLIGEVNYGGRITDNNDRKLVNIYIRSFFNDNSIKITNYTLSELNTIYIPDDNKNSLKSYIEYIESLQNNNDDDPRLFGQHPNADMSSHMKETTILLDTLLSFESATTSQQTVVDEEEDDDDNNNKSNNRGIQKHKSI